MVEEIEMETGTQLMKAGCHCYWSRLPDSNRGPPDYKSGALPTELKRLTSKNKTMTYQINTTQSEHLAILPGQGSI